MVFIDRRPRRLSAASVIYDDVGGARAAIEHLVEHGHRRIAFAGDSLSVPTTAQRRHGYETTLFDSGCRGRSVPRLVRRRHLAGRPPPAGVGRAANGDLLGESQLLGSRRPATARRRPCRHPGGELRRLPARRHPRPAGHGDRPGSVRARPVRRRAAVPAHRQSRQAAPTADCRPGQTAGQGLLPAKETEQRRLTGANVPQRSGLNGAHGMGANRRSRCGCESALAVWVRTGAENSCPHHVEGRHRAPTSRVKGPSGRRPQRSNP